MTLFKNPIPLTPNNFQIGMKLEAIDPENLSLFCVCTVVDIKGYRIKLSFDGFESMYDFWVNADSPDIFPPGWCALTNRVLQPPKDCNPATFNWYKYLQIEKGVAAPKNLFPHLYKKQVTMNKFQASIFNYYKIHFQLIYGIFILNVVIISLFYLVFYIPNFLHLLYIYIYNT